MDPLIVTHDVSTRVCHLTLNRPEKRNALNQELKALLFNSIREYGDRSDVSCILLTGAGSTFCAGDDIVESRQKDVEGGSGSAQRGAVGHWRVLREHMANARLIREIPIPLVVGIQGHCYGMGLMLASFADIVVMADDAMFGTARFAAGAGYWGPPLAFLSAGRKGREMELRSGRFTGKEAAAMGWANYSVPPSDLLDTVHEIANDVASQPRDLLELRKAAMNFAQDIQGFSLAMTAVELWDAMGNASPVAEATFASIVDSGLHAVLR
jgi:enoyl-CoA hydratase